MNKRCKDALYHAWTNTTPEQVSAYNRGYYQKNKADWVTRKKQRARASSVSKAISSTPPTRTKSGIARLDFEKTGGILYDIVEAGKNFIKNVVNTTIEWRKTVHEERHDTSNTIGALIKSGWNWLKNWFNS